MSWQKFRKGAQRIGRSRSHRAARADRRASRTLTRDTHVGISLQSSGFSATGYGRGLGHRIQRAYAALGYRHLETYGFDADALKYYGMAAAEFRKVLGDLDLTTTSGHYDLHRFLNQPVESMAAYVNRCIQGALALNQKYITWAWLDLQSRSLESLKLVAERLNVVGAQVAKAGLKVAYHNHDFEFVPHDGKIGYDIILRETDPDLVKLQIDLYWVAHSSARTVDLN